MRTRENILEVVLLIYSAIDNLNSQNNLTVQNGEIITKALTTKLFGADSGIDSIMLVTLIVLVETEVNAWFGTQITIADDRAMSCQHSPFKTVKTLAEYVLTLLNNDKS